MSLLRDPHICPDCRAPLDEARTCTGCGLALHGAVAAEIWRHLQRADELIDSLRRVPAATRVPAAAPLSPVPGLRTAPARTTVEPQPRRLNSLSVPAILLGLGGICVLVAATVFVAVTWGSLGLTGRTTIMIGITAIAGSGAAMLTRRGLRGSAETLWLITAVLVLIDVIAARFAGMVGDLDPRHVAGLVGGVLLLGSLAVSLWVATTTTRTLAVPVGIAGASAFLVTAAEAWTTRSAALDTAISLPLLVGAALLTGRAFGGRLRTSAYAIGGVAVLSWSALVIQGLSRSSEITAAAWWNDLRCWPLLLAAGCAAAPTAVRRIPGSLRSLLAAISLTVGCLAALGGTTDGQTKLLVASGVAVALAALASIAGQVWSPAAASLAAVAAIGASASVLLRPVDLISTLPITGPARAANLGLRLPETSWMLSPWTAAILGAVAAVTTLSLVRHLPATARSTGTKVGIVIAPALTATGLVTAFLESRPELLAATAAWCVLLVISGALTFAMRDCAPVLATALMLDLYAIGVGFRLAAPSHLLVAIIATIVTLVLALCMERARTERLEGALVPAFAGSAVLLGAIATTQWRYVVDATGTTTGIVLALLAAAIGIAAARLGRTEATRISLELTALLVALVAPFFPADETMTAVTLTIAGGAVALVSIVQRDRDGFSWFAAGLVTIATLMRLGHHASAPELFALPVACLLVGAGVWRLLGDDRVTSWRALSSGLSVGLIPSLLLALNDPVSLRGVLIAAAGLITLAVGINRRWAAPFLAGSGVVAVVAVRHLEPVAAALPRWISLGSVGVVLLLVGITWEARRKNLQYAERYLTSLR